MGRWAAVILATSLSLLALAGGQRVPWAVQQVHQVQRGIGFRSLALGTAAAPQPFAAVRPPSWSGTDAAVLQAQDRLKQRPDDAAAYALLGGLYLQKVREAGDPTYLGKAEGVLRKALELAPDSEPAAAGMGHLQLSLHRFADALAWGERARDLAPGSALPYGIIADAYTELGRYPEAIDALQAMVDLRPDLASLSRISYARELHGDLPGAIEAMEQAVSAGAPGSEATNWARVHLGHLYFFSGDLDKAEAQYRMTLRALPNYVHGLAGLARVAAGRGKLHESASLYTQALDVVPLPEYAIALSEVYRALGETSNAERQEGLVRVIARLQRASGVDVDLEMALFEADHAQDAVALAEAVQTARASYTRRPSIHAADVLAWTLYRAGRPQEALAHAREALRLGTQDPLLLFHAGAVAAATGEAAEARGYLEAAVSQNPRFSVRYAPEARRLLATLAAATGERG